MSKFWMAIGGRKFAIALLVIAAGSAVDILTERGLSVNLAGLLAAVLTAFAASNVVATKVFADSKTGNAANSATPAAALGNEVSAMHAKVTKLAADLEAQQKLTEQIAVASGQTQTAIMTIAQYAANTQVPR